MKKIMVNVLRLVCWASSTALFLGSFTRVWAGVVGNDPMFYLAGSIGMLTSLAIFIVPFSVDDFVGDK